MAESVSSCRKRCMANSFCWHMTVAVSAWRLRTAMLTDLYLTGHLADEADRRR